MAQRFLSPGVFTTELDQSFLAQGVAGIGACIVGRTLKGPACVPTVVGGFDQFVNSFGATDPSMQMPYATRNYLRNSGAATVVRVLGHADGTGTTNGYTVGYSTGIADTVTGSAGRVLAVIHSDYSASFTGVPLSTTDFIVKITSASTDLFAATASFQTSSANYIEKVLNTDPTKYSTYHHYLHQNFSYITPAASASWTKMDISGALTSYTKDFQGGVTPFIKSQPLGGREFDLFKFYTVGDGNITNKELKVEISNIKPSASPTATPYGTFDILVRDFNDSDQRRVILETFAGCSLDPKSLSYVARRIGDMSETFDSAQRKFISNGTYPRKSKLIRIEMDTTTGAPAEALPWGFNGYTKSVFSSNQATYPTVSSLPYTISQLDKNGNFDANISWGVSFVSGGIEDRMKTDPVNSTGGYLATDTAFSMQYLSGAYINNKLVYYYNTAQTTPHTAVYASASLYKFTMPFAGGFDGWDARVKDPLYLTNSADETNIGVTSTKRALDAVANPDAFDMNVLAVPGIHNLKVTDYARSVVNDRRDVIYIMDITGSSVQEAVGGMKNRELDDNYSACYYPDLKLNDVNSAQIVRVSPSVAVLGAFAFSDRVGQVFFAPAGLNRGGLAQFDIVDVADRLTFQDRNDLYDNRINPIATFPNEGIVVFGQKTLQIKASALDRINVRRLMIYAKKTIASAAKYLLFEPGNPTTWQRFTNMVNPILEKIRQDQGIERFKVVMDNTTNTPDIVDRNIMAGKIFLAPTKSAEFIDLSFIITSSGVTFGE